MMTEASINIRIDRDVKNAAENIFKELGINMTSAINMFLKQTVRDRALPFQPALTNLNQETLEAIEEGKKIAYDPNIKGYTSIEDLKKALEE